MFRPVCDKIIWRILLSQYKITSHTSVGLFSTSWSIDLAKGSFKYRLFGRLWLCNDGDLLFLNFFPPKIVFNKKAKVTNGQCYLKQKPMEAHIFHVLPLASAWSRTAEFNIYLNVVGIYCFLLTRCFWSVDLRKKNYQASSVISKTFNIYQDAANFVD